MIVDFAPRSMVGATVLCFFATQEREMTRWDGWLRILNAGFTGDLNGLFCSYTLPWNLW